MRLVDKKQLVEESAPLPHRCAFSGGTDGPFLDTGFWLNARQLDTVDPYGYIEVPFLETMAREIGMVPQNEVERLQERLAALEDALHEAERQIDAIATLKEVLA